MGPSQVKDIIASFWEAQEVQGSWKEVMFNISASQKGNVISAA